jgi:parafibromin
MPIIIVPNSTASCISILNASDFLVDGTFVSTDQKKRDGARREAEVVIRRTDPSTRETREYKIIDNPTTLRVEEWDRVVAVFVSGQLWQFKGWKWAQPVDLFRQVLGVYLTFDDRAVDSNVLSWNCKIIKV